MKKYTEIHVHIYEADYVYPVPENTLPGGLVALDICKDSILKEAWENATPSELIHIYDRVVDDFNVDEDLKETYLKVLDSKIKRWLLECADSVKPNSKCSKNEAISNWANIPYITMCYLLDKYEKELFHTGPITADKILYMDMFAYVQEHIRGVKHYTGPISFNSLKEANQGLATIGVETHKEETTAKDGGEIVQKAPHYQDIPFFDRNGNEVDLEAWEIITSILKYLNLNPAASWAMGDALKYILRCGRKFGDEKAKTKEEKAIQDLRKVAYYINKVADWYCGIGANKDEESTTGNK